MESIPVFEINWIVSLVLAVLCSLNCLFLKKICCLCHCRGHNTLYETGLILQFPRLEVLFEIYNIPAGYCKFQTSRRDVVKWKQNKQQNQTKQIIEEWLFIIRM
jgi:hypothetical protein